ncbi:MAG: S1 RNA-binding domain-containing protein [Erysipelotrichaceae bacterium]|nr:S1 RNA-binding domain-containing protein [Erysipelotrichaceae bacterium]
MSYQVGQIVYGTVTGIQPYGAFIHVDEHTNGLLHISEISEDFVRDVHYFVKIGEEVQVKIVDIDETTGQLRLSLKALRKSTVRKDRKHQRKDHLPPMVIGFRSLESHMEGWIAEKYHPESKE